MNGVQRPKILVILNGFNMPGKSLTQKETAWKMLDVSMNEMAMLPVFEEGQEFHPVVLGQADGGGFNQDLNENISFLG